MKNNKLLNNLVEQINPEGLNKDQCDCLGKCPFCSKCVTKDSFGDDKLSLSEFYISGLCKFCQNEMFGTNE